MSESGLFQDCNFDINEGNLLKEDTLNDDDNISKSGGQASS